MNKFTIGTDPEFMIVQAGRLKNAIGILPPKKKPKTVGGHKFYYDNVLAEIAVQPAKTKAEFVKNIGEALKIFSGILKKDKFELTVAAKYPAKELESDEAKVAGCIPEMSVYTLQRISPPIEKVDLINGYFYFKTPLRTAGGHIHLGSEFLLDSANMLATVRMMDLFIGVPSVLLDTDPTSKERRKLYGLAGSHRTTEYGLEYRPLGNFWFSAPEYVELIYDLCDFTLDFVQNDNQKRFWTVDKDLLDEEDPSIAYSCFGYDVEALQKCINLCDKKLAKKFMMFADTYMPSKLLQRIENLIDKQLPDPYTSWKLNVS